MWKYVINLAVKEEVELQLLNWLNVIIFLEGRYYSNI